MSHEKGNAKIEDNYKGGYAGKQAKNYHSGAKYFGKDDEGSSDGGAKAHKGHHVGLNILEVCYFLVTMMEQKNAKAQTKDEHPCIECIIVYTGGKNFHDR